jgi:NAD(P)-dependent dehydrogenase (short-subunit alcohol dehydrogenase family)
MPEEIAASVLFLASQSANNIVGQIIAIDGGSYENTTTKANSSFW